MKVVTGAKKPAKPLLIIDPNIAKDWHIAPQNLWVHGGKTLASLKIEELPNLKNLWQDVVIIEPHELFLGEFIFIDAEKALPKSLLPNGTDSLEFNVKHITPLIPLNPILLDYFTPEELNKKIQFQPLNGSTGSQVRVTIDLPLTGLQDGNPQNYRLSQDYALKEENALPQVPVLEIWPNFRFPGWQEYYAFYYDGEYAEETFQIHLPQAKEPKIFQQTRGSYQLARLDEFPEYIQCQDMNRKLIGLILLPTPIEIKPHDSWLVGVDFGTSFTNIYINKNRIAEPASLEDLLFQVTDYPSTARIDVLLEYFIPENFIPKEQPLPMSSVLTTKGSQETKEDRVRPIFDGRIYSPDNTERFKPLASWIKTNLKWSKENIAFNQLFWKHLGLHISALAAKNGVKEIQWCISYPSAFSRNETTRYVQEWRKLTEELQIKTGITHKYPDITNQQYLRTESLATAQYFRDQEGHRLVKTTCIDMGGGTSDISIWEDNKLVHQCSVQLAGRDVFSQFLELNPQFLEGKFKANLSDWKGLKGGAFNAKLDVLLRLEADNWLRNGRTRVEDDEDFKGLIRLTAIGMAGLYYYVGILLKVLNKENKYKRKAITEVYIGGNASRFLNWLAVGGQFDANAEVNDLFSRMLSKGSGFKDDQVTTRLSQRPKDEVACGLVLSDTPLEGKNLKDEDPLIAGESCEIKIAGESYEINGKKISIYDPLNFDEEDSNKFTIRTEHGEKSIILRVGADDKLNFDEEDIREFIIPELIILPQFLDDFHQALKDLKIESITPLPVYKPKNNHEKSKLWSEVKDELDSLLLDLKGKSENIRLEPPFILSLKALLKVLGGQWARK